MLLKKARAVGIDPGYSGAAVCIDIEVVNNTLGEVTCGDMRVIEFPYYLYKQAKLKTKLIEYQELINDLESMLYPSEVVVIENVKAMPRDGGTSAFNFGYFTGTLRGVVESCKHCLVDYESIPPFDILNPRPQEWKSKLGFPSGATKQDSVKMAELYFPEFKDKFYGPRGGIKDGVAEAALMALYGINDLTEGEQ